jgi:soluble lytic murein transglycosylase
MPAAPTTPHRLAPLFGLLALITACADRAATAAPPAHSTARPVEVGTASAPAPTSAPAAPRPSEATWVQAVRVGRWSDAARLLDALSEAERARPAIRFVRARVAAEVGDHTRAVALLKDLKEPALLVDDIERALAESALVAGPFEIAAQHYARSSRPRDLVRAAQAQEKAGDAKAALALVDRAVATAQRLRRWSDERAARALRWRLHGALGKAGAGQPDLEWLATEAASTGDGRAARAELDARKRKLSPRQNRRAIEVLAEAGEADAAIALIDRGDHGLSRAERLHWRAEALFEARRWKASIGALEEARKVKSGRAAEQSYLLGRALARVDRDDDARAAWRDVAKRFPRTDFGDRATYQLARIDLSSGKYEAARDGYVAYLAKYPKGALADDARYELALAYLSAKQPDEARKRFADMASRARNLDIGVYRELEAVAAARAGDVEGAKRIWTGVAEDQPLTWAAMTSRARLASVGAPLPPLFANGGGGPPAEPLAVALPPKAALLASLGLDADAEAHIEDNEQALAAPYAGRESEALCTMYAKLSRAKRRYKVGSAAVSFEALMREPGPSERWGWDCVYPRPYADAVTELEAKRSLPSGLVHALMRQESGFDPEIGSPVGARGLLQLMPATAKEAAKEASVPFSPELVTVPDVNIALGGFYIGKLLGTFQGSLPLAVASYNAGPGAVSSWLKKGVETEVDVWVARIPYDETRNYVVRVMGNLVRYQWLAGGEAAVTEVALQIPLVRAPDDAY